MKSIKQLIFERDAAPVASPAPTQPQGQAPQGQKPAQGPGSAREKELAPYREAARMLVNISKGLDPKSQQAVQVRAKLKKPMEQFVNLQNFHDDAKLNHLFRAIEDEVKKQGVDKRGLISILQIVGGSVGSASKRLLNLHYNTAPIH
jgi:hypothetical protein